MRFQGNSLEELEELEQELLGLGETKLGGLSYSKIEVYDAMHSQLEELVQDDEDYRAYYSYIKKKLVSYLLRYGMHTYTDHLTIYEDTEKVLKKVLSYDSQNPIAAYRLGFLAYRSGIHSEAVMYFQQALNSQTFYIDERFLLNAEQISRAVLYLTNSALHTAIQGEVPSCDIISTGYTSLPTQLCYNDGMLNSHAYRIVTPFGAVLCSEEESGEQQMKDVISLKFNKFGALLTYNGISEQLSPVQANVLRYLLVKTRRGEAATPWSLKDYFLFTHVITGVPEKTFSSVVAEVKRIMAEMEIPASIKVAEDEKSGYYFDGSSPFVVIDRVDEELSL
ncbi:tetratricopeptide repeat protein [Planococcus shenhongbingii]|uniref:Tetratricopeptide repeat protein n=1 Tax=Planococcus shenhongbingii TaxID=3058398 RepID=A0ABT8N7Q7_9BACL|nr:hypothetical protein [Planococcus sp. N017]MDN7243914.1 hypothetical protein [Planococcus sp. N017]